MLFSAAPASAQSPSSPNLLNNPSFEGGMYHMSMSNFIAEGWSYWYQGRAADDPRGWWMPEPEFGLIADRPGQMRSGAKSQRWFNTWAIHNAGLYQTVTVPDNSWLRFSIWMFNCSSEQDFFCISEGYHSKWVGIDPTGGADPFSPNIVWGNEDRTMDVWAQIGVIAQAKGNKVTVFVREQPQYSLKHNDILLDDAELVVIPEPAQPVVQPVATGSVAVTDNTTPEKAAAIGFVPSTAGMPGSPVGEYRYFSIDYPGGFKLYTINIKAQGDARILSKFTFRVYEPTSGKVVAQSGYVHGGRANVVTDLQWGTKGKYLVQVINENNFEPVDYRIWLSSPGVIPEVASTFAQTS
jgi:hypothetical protein